MTVGHHQPSSCQRVRSASLSSTSCRLSWIHQEGAGAPSPTASAEPPTASRTRPTSPSSTRLTVLSTGLTPSVRAAPRAPTAVGGRASPSPLIGFGERGVQVGAYVVQFTEVRDARGRRRLARRIRTRTDCTPDDLHGPVAQHHGGGVAVQSGAYVGVGAPHRQHGAQAGRDGEDDQPEAEGGGDARADQHPGVVQGPLGELAGQVAAPGHGRPGRPVRRRCRTGRRPRRAGAAAPRCRRDPARRPEAALAAGLASRVQDRWQPYATAAACVRPVPSR